MAGRHRTGERRQRRNMTGRTGHNIRGRGRFHEARRKLGNGRPAGRHQRHPGDQGDSIPRFHVVFLA